MVEIKMVLVMVFVVCAFIHTYTDFKEGLLYDEISLILLLAGLGYSLLDKGVVFGIKGAAITGLVFFLLFGFCKGGMGFGDVKLAVVMGAWLGWELGLFSLLIALCLGTVAGGALLLIGNKQWQDAIPFGPYLCLSGGIMLVYGEELLSWYKGLFC